MEGGQVRALIGKREVPLVEAEASEVLYAHRTCCFGWPVPVPHQISPSGVVRQTELFMCAEGEGQVDKEGLGWAGVMVTLAHISLSWRCW